MVFVIIITAVFLEGEDRSAVYPHHISSLTYYWPKFTNNSIMDINNKINRLTLKLVLVNGRLPFN